MAQDVRRPQDSEVLLDLRLLNVFVAVTRHGNMTAAARQLGLTQSAVSQSIRKLEDELQVVLIDREHRPLQLTAAGGALSERAGALIDQARHLPSLLQELGRAKLPEMRVGLADSIAATIGPSLIRDLLESTVRLSVYSGLSPAHAQGLMNRSLDLAILSDALEDIDDLDRHPLMREPFILLVPAEWPSDADQKDLADLVAEAPFIRYSARSHIGAQIDRHMRRLGLAAPRLIEIDSSGALVAMVAGGLGWAITTPLCLLQGRVDGHRVRALKLPGPGFSRSIFLLVRSGEYSELPAKVAINARRLISDLERTEIRRLVPWLTEVLAVSSDAPSS